MLSVSYISRESCVVSLSLSSLMMYANDRVHRVNGPMVVFFSLYITLSHHHHYADVSESIELLKCLSGTFIECMFKVKSSLSINFLVMIVRIRVLYLIIIIIIIKSEVWTICHCLGLGRETMEYAVCLFYVLIMTSWHGNTFHITRPWWRESTSHQWIPLRNGQ